MFSIIYPPSGIVTFNPSRHVTSCIRTEQPRQSSGSGMLFLPKWRIRFQRLHLLTLPSRSGQGRGSKELISYSKTGGSSLGKSSKGKVLQTGQNGPSRLDSAGLSGWFGNWPNTANLYLSASWALILSIWVGVGITLAVLKQNICCSSQLSELPLISLLGPFLETPFRIICTLLVINTEKARRISRLADVFEVRAEPNWSSAYLCAAMGAHFIL